MGLDCALKDHHLAPPPAQPMLSIIIPTFNRAKELAETLAYFVPEMEQHAGRVEFVVSDNASTDRTHSLCRKWAEAYPWFSYYIHAENQGTARQLFLGPQRARCRYVWMFGDDDSIQAGTVARVLDILDTQNIGFLTLNREVRDRNMKTVLSERANTAPDRRFESFEAFLRSFSVYQIGFISAQIFDRDPFLGIDPTPYINAEGYLQVGAYMEAFRNTPTYYCAEPLVTYRFNNFANRDKALFSNTLNLTLPLMRILDTAGRRAGYPDDFVEQMCGTRNTTNYAAAPTLRVTDLILEKILLSVDFGHFYSPEDWLEIFALAKHWRPAASSLLQIVFTTANDVAKIHDQIAAADKARAEIRRSRDVPRARRDADMAHATRHIQSLQLHLQHALRQVVGAASLISQSGAEGLLSHTQAA